MGPRSRDEVFALWIIPHAQHEPHVWWGMGSMYHSESWQAQGPAFRIPIEAITKNQRQLKAEFNWLLHQAGFSL